MSLPVLHSRFSLPKRLALSSFVLIVELLCLTIAVDLEPLVGSPGFSGLTGRYGSLSLHLLVVWAGFSVAFAAFRRPELFADSTEALERRQFGEAASIHLLIFGGFATCSVLVCRAPAGIGRDALIVGAAVSGGATIFSGAIALVELSFWKTLLRGAPRAPWWGAAAAIGTLAAVREGNWFVRPWLSLTLTACYRVLRLLPLDVTCDPVKSVLSTNRFSVQISPECSGYEGMMLILAFSAAWLVFFRRDFRFPQALLMIPAGMALSWVFNVCRIVALLLIGHAGAPRIAAGGFHSLAGWMAFVGLAVVLALVVQRSSWTTVRPREGQQAESALATETAAYLMPFLVILAAGMMAQVASSGFEWLYALRVIAALVALWVYRKTLRKLEWQAGWGAAIGAAVFLLWIGWDRIAGGSRSGMPPEMAHAPTLARSAWIACRVVGAVITVPVAEELAFRGYLMRRFVSPAFAAIAFRAVPLWAVAVSSFLFGVLHGRFWVPGILAGLLYAIAARRRERIGDAAGAHAVTNALLAVWVLATGDWRLW